MKNIVKALALAGITAMGAHAAPTLQLNEFLLNVPGGTDAGHQFIEVKGGASESVNNVWVLEIDSNGGTNGQVLNAFDLTAQGTVGSNGLLLIRDSGTVLSPAPAAATTVTVRTFSAALTNNTTTIALVVGFSASVGTDLDTNDDGTLDSTPWTSVLDAVTMQDSGGGDFPHADDMGGTVIPIQTSPAYTPDALMRSPIDNSWVFGDVLGTNPGPYTFDNTQVSSPLFAGGTLNAGNDNSTVPVELSSYSIE